MMQRITKPGVKLFLLALLFLFCASACSTPSLKDKNAESTAEISTQASTPRYIIYYNSDASPLSAALNTPYTHIILSFVTAAINHQQAIELHVNKNLAPFWSDVAKLQANGKKVMISFGGGEFQAADYAPLAGRENELAALLANFVQDKGLDGIDIDYEASATFLTERQPGVIDGRAFLIRLTQALRQQLPAPRYLLSHAPQPPYLSATWHGGPYLDVIQSVGGQIDWIAVQYYDNPGFDSPVTSHIVGTTSPPLATSYHGLTNINGPLAWPARKLLVGKPVYQADAASGHITPQQVIKEIITPLKHAYGNRFGGLMGWQFSTLTADHQAWNSLVGQALLSDKTSPSNTQKRVSSLSIATH